MQCKWNSGRRMPFQLASARVTSSASAACPAQPWEEEPLWGSESEGNPSSCSQQQASCILFQQAEDGAMPVYMLYKIFPRIWKKIYVGCLIPVRRLLAPKSSDCFSYLFWRESSFSHQICICRSMVLISSDLVTVVYLLAYWGNLPTAASIPYHRPCFLPCLQDVVLHKNFKTNTRGNSEEFI